MKRIVNLFFEPIAVFGLWDLFLYVNDVKPCIFVWAMKEQAKLNMNSRSCITYLQINLCQAAALYKNSRCKKSTRETKRGMQSIPVPALVLENQYGHRTAVEQWEQNEHTIMATMYYTQGLSVLQNVRRRKNKMTHNVIPI